MRNGKRHSKALEYAVYGNVIIIVKSRSLRMIRNVNNTEIIIHCTKCNKTVCNCLCTFLNHATEIKYLGIIVDQHNMKWKDRFVNLHIRKCIVIHIRLRDKN